MEATLSRVESGGPLSRNFGFGLLIRSHPQNRDRLGRGSAPPLWRRTTYSAAIATFSATGGRTRFRDSLNWVGLPITSRQQLNPGPSGEDADHFGQPRDVGSHIPRQARWIADTRALKHFIFLVRLVGAPLARTWRRSEEEYHAYPLHSPQHLG